MKNILCYGDSNTHGYDAKTNGGRYPKQIRWPGILQKELGSDYNVIEEGLSGRTTVWEDRTLGLISGADYLYPCLCSHKPLDMVIVMLGTNDTKKMYGASARDICFGMNRIVDIVLKSESGRNGCAPDVLVVSPPIIADLPEDLMQMFEDSQEKSKLLPLYYKSLAEKCGTLFLDASSIVKTCDIDGIHLDADNHRKIGCAIAANVLDHYK